MYKLHKTTEGLINSVTTTNGNVTISIPLTDPANTDYQNFKKQINADEAQLEDAEGITMSADAAKEYIKTLP
jgi:hypothetical protein